MNGGHVCPGKEADRERRKCKNKPIFRLFSTIQCCPKIDLNLFVAPDFPRLHHTFCFVLFCSFLNFCIIYIYSDFDALFISSHRMQFKQTNKNMQ